MGLWSVDNGADSKPGPLQCLNYQPEAMDPQGRLSVCERAQQLGACVLSVRVWTCNKDGPGPEVKRGAATGWLAMALMCRWLVQLNCPTLHIISRLPVNPVLPKTCQQKNQSRSVARSGFMELRYYFRCIKTWSICSKANCFLVQCCGPGHSGMPWPPNHETTLMSCCFND
jgi:hypothetical protein